MRRISLALVCVMVLFSCESANFAVPSATDYAELVTIYRDEFGVPHVHGVTNGAAAYGFGYAQAEDNFWQLEDNFIRAIGRASEIYGSETLRSDWINRAMETESLSKREYEKSGREIRSILDGFADGVNAFISTQPENRARLLNKIEPWYPLALIRYLYYQNGFLRRSGVTGSMTERAARLSALEPDSPLIGRIRASDLPVTELPVSEQGSNSMAVSATKSASGHPMLFINPHLPFFGTSQVYEGHIISDEGWNFSGYTRFGFPMPYVGFNESIGWASTDNAADLADAYAEKFDDPARPAAYRYGDTHRMATEWIERIVVNTSGRTDTLTFGMRKTHHGPILGHSDDGYIAVRMAKYETPGWLAQWFEMTRATDFPSFTRAVSRLDMLFGNYLYADRDGNIYYVYNAAIPRRMAGFNWRGIVDGSDPLTEWDGYHTLEEIPQVLNPESGWLQNCNSTPFLSTLRANPDRDDYPSYMVRDGDTARSRAARRILESQDRFSFEDWMRHAYDTFVITADEDLPYLIRDWEDLKERDPVRAQPLQAAIFLLRDWDRISRVESEAMTLFVYAGERTSGPGISLGGLEQAIAALEQEWGSWQVPWGDVNRLQRVQSNGTGFSDERTSIAVGGVPSWAGSMFTFWSQSPAGQKRRYGTGGNSYVAVIEFGPEVNARSLHTFGANADPSSEHYFDQARRYASGAFKPAWLTISDVTENAVRSYRPAQVPAE